MIRCLRAIVFTVALILSAGLLSAQSSGVGLGLSVGLAFPQGQTDGIALTDWSGSFNWGFYVDIPLLHTFHLTPSAELYRLGPNNATDIGLGFKFILPLQRIHVFAGVAPGLTATGEVTAFHVGGLGGVSFRLADNLEVFGRLKYNVLFDGDRNVRVLHTNAGILFTL